MRSIAPFVSGALFALGLALSGMTQPSKVIGFLDFTGRWDPTLAFVMVGAIGVHIFAYVWVKRRATPLAEKSFDVPTSTRLDGRLIAGAAVFGVGWGLSGYCPGPAVVSLASGMLAPLVMVATMLIGMIGYERVLGGARAASTPKRDGTEDLI